MRRRDRRRKLTGEEDRTRMPSLTLTAVHKSTVLSGQDHRRDDFIFADYL